MAVSLKARDRVHAHYLECNYGCCTEIFNRKTKVVARRIIRRIAKQELRKEIAQ